MPEIRYIRTYEQGTGVLLSQEPYEVSDEKLHQEALEREANDRSHRIYDLYNSWDGLTPPQQWQAIKDLLWFVLLERGLL